VAEEQPSGQATQSVAGSVLVVEDEPDLADMYASYLADPFDSDVVYSGKEALEVLDDSYDVVLLDRRMPVVSGNEVLAYIEDQGLDLRVALVTAVDPDFDIIDLQIDDYIVKPATKRDIQETVERLRKLDEYDEQKRRLTSKKLKRNVLQVEKSRQELAESAEFERLNKEIAALEAEVDAIEQELRARNVDN
jgi:DNA-binding response OmpR family regulator